MYIVMYYFFKFLFSIRRELFRITKKERIFIHATQWKKC